MSNTQRKPILKPVTDEPVKKVPEWAIDEVRNKPKLKPPHFPDHSKQPEKIGAVKKRLAELPKPKRGKKVEPELKLTFWQRVFGLERVDKNR